MLSSTICIPAELHSAATSLELIHCPSEISIPEIIRPSEPSCFPELGSLPDLAHLHDLG